MSELRPCPFCGGTNLYITDSYQNNPFFYNVICKGCGIRWISLDKRFLNTRPIEDGLIAEVNRLNNVIDRTIVVWENRVAEKENEICHLNFLIDELLKAGWTMWREGNLKGHDTPGEITWGFVADKVQKERE